MDSDQKSRRRSHRNRLFMLLVSVAAISILATACSALGSETTTTTVQPTTTTSEIDRLIEETEILTEWLDSVARRLAVNLWKQDVNRAMDAYLISGFISGEIGRGDCPVGRTGISIDCQADESLNDWAYEAVERFGMCPDGLQEYGCSPIEDFTGWVRETWFEERGYDYSGWDS